MTTTNTAIEIIRGDDITINCAFKDADGVAINITGYTVFLTVKNRLGDADADALISETVSSHTDPTNGITVITLDNSQTDVDEGSYFYDFQLKTGAGKIQSTKRGAFNVLTDVTTRTS